MNKIVTDENFKGISIKLALGTFALHRNTDVYFTSHRSPTNQASGTGGPNLHPKNQGQHHILWQPFSVPVVVPLLGKDEEISVISPIHMRGDFF